MNVPATVSDVLEREDSIVFVNVNTVSEKQLICDYTATFKALQYKLDVLKIHDVSAKNTLYIFLKSVTLVLCIC